MSNKKRVSESELMTLTPFQLVLGDIPSPNPERGHNKEKVFIKPVRNMEEVIHKLINHIKTKV